MSETRALVEHSFHHECGRLVAVLTRSLSVRRLALGDDAVQAALAQALASSVTAWADTLPPSAPGEKLCA